MKPGDKIEYNKATHKITATQVHPNDYIEWTKGNIYFEKESLENIMKTLSRIYDVEIRFDSNKLPKGIFHRNHSWWRHTECIEYSDAYFTFLL